MNDIQAVQQSLGIDQTPGQGDGVHLSFLGLPRKPDLLGDLIDHGFKNLSRLLVSRRDPCLEMTPSGLIRAEEDMSTNLPGVFAGGDVRLRFARNATDAIADGQRAARSILGYLRGKKLRVRKKSYMRALAPDLRIPAATR